MINLQDVLHSMFTTSINSGRRRLAGSMFAFIRTGKAAPGRLGFNSAPVVKTNNSAQTLTADEMKAAIYKRDCNGADRSDVTPTAALWVAAFPKAQVNDQYEWVVWNNGSANTLTVTGGTTVTVVGTATVAFGVIRRFLVLFTNVTSGSEAITVISIG